MLRLISELAPYKKKDFIWYSDSYIYTAKFFPKI